MKDKRKLTETIVRYNPCDRLSWNEGGVWPHKNHFGFHEAVVIAHLALRGYQCISQYSTTSPPKGNSISDFYTGIFRNVVGSEISDFLTNSLDNDAGQPDLFVFRPPDNPKDPKIKYQESLVWFWVEVKGAFGGRIENVRNTQKKFF
jgi:hypothetical protein